MADKKVEIKVALQKKADSKKKGTFVGFKALSAKTSPAITAALNRKKKK